MKKDAQDLSAHMCAISEVVGCLLSLPPLLMFSSVLCVCPAHPLPFNPPFTMTMAACRDPLPCIALTTAGYWQGPIHCCNLPRTIKRLAGPARPPCKQPAPHLLCLPSLLPGTEAGWWSCWVYVLGFVRGGKRRGLVLCTQ